jgi:hypothetical protein
MTEGFTMMNIDAIDRMMRRAIFLSVILLSGCTGLELADTRSLLLPRLHRLRSLPL